MRPTVPAGFALIVCAAVACAPSAWALDAIPLPVTYDADWQVMRPSEIHDPSAGVDRTGIAIKSGLIAHARSTGSRDHTPVVNEGVVYFWRKVGSNWRSTPGPGQRLSPPETPDVDRFGSGLAWSPSGSFLAVGQSGWDFAESFMDDDEVRYDAGRVLLYRSPPGSPGVIDADPSTANVVEPEQTLIALPPLAQAHLGRGEICWIGNDVLAVSESQYQATAGAVTPQSVVFFWTDDGWYSYESFRVWYNGDAGLQAHDRFGAVMAASHDASRFLASAYIANQVLVFTTTDDWETEENLTIVTIDAPVGNGSSFANPSVPYTRMNSDTLIGFGSSMALSPNGDYLVIGSPKELTNMKDPWVPSDPDNHGFSGAAYVYEWNGTSYGNDPIRLHGADYREDEWEQEEADSLQWLGERFGTQCAVSDSGRIYVSAPFAEDGGRVYQFQIDGGAIRQLGHVSHPDADPADRRPFGLLGLEINNLDPKEVFVPVLEIEDDSARTAIHSAVFDPP